MSTLTNPRSGRVAALLCLSLAGSSLLYSQAKPLAEPKPQSATALTTGIGIGTNTRTTSEEDETNSSPRERGRILQKRNPIASEYQVLGELGESPGADADGEGVDYRSFFPSGRLLSGAESSFGFDYNLNYNENSGEAESGGGLSFKRTFGNDSRWALAAQFRTSASDRQIEHYEAVWQELSLLDKDANYPLSPDDELGIYYLDRPRYSVDEIYTRNNIYSAQIEFKASENHTLYFKSYYQDYFDNFYRNRLELQYGAGTLEGANIGEIDEPILESGSLTDARTRRYFGDTDTERKRTHLTFGGAIEGKKWDIDYSVYTQQWDIDRVWYNWNFNDFGLDLSYDLSDPTLATFTVGGMPDLLDQSDARFSSLRIHNSFTSDEDLAFRIDGERRLSLFEKDVWIQTGFLHREKERNAGEDRQVFGVNADDPFYLSDIERSAPSEYTIDGQFPQQSGLDATAGALLLQADPNKFLQNAFREKVESNQNIYSAFESVSSVYFMGVSEIENWTLEAGVRYEETKTETIGTVVIPEIVDDPNEGVLLEKIQASDSSYLVIKDLDADNRYDTLLPSFELSYAFSEKTTLKGSWYSTIMRPQYFSIVNYRRVSIPTRSISEGNPNLEPTSIEKSRLALIQDFDSFGKVSVEAYLIDVEDFFYGTVSNEFILEDGAPVEYSIGRTENGETAQISGYEFQWENKLEKALLWKNANISLAYTYSDSESTVSTRPNETLFVPQRSKHLLKAGLSGQTGPLRTSVSFTFQSNSLDDIGDRAAEDEYREKVISLSLNNTYKIDDKTQIYLNLYNLTDQPERAHEGNLLKNIRNQYSGRYAIFGFKRSY